MPPQNAPPPLTTGLTLLLAITAGLGAANIYYAQPMIALFQASFGANPAAAALVSTAAQLGYTIGIIFLVPLGDRFERRRLILILCAVLIASLLAAAAAPALPWLIAAAIPIGIASTLAQQAIPLAGSLATPADRGAVVGRVISGLLAGILLARALAGLVGEHYGWRAMFVLGALMATGLFIAVWRAVPRIAPPSQQPYPALLLSLLTLWRRHPILRRASIVQGFAFGALTVFWSTLALHLEQPPFHLGADATGLFGILGLTGVLIAPQAGRLADRLGPWTVTMGGALLVLAGWLLLATIPGLPGIALGVIILDAGIQAMLVGNQADVFALEPNAQSRLNTIFVAGIFIGGSTGSIAGSLAWLAAGWLGVLGAGTAFTVLGLLIHYTGRPE